MRSLILIVLFAVTEAASAADDLSKNGSACWQAISSMGMVVASLVYNFGEIRDDSGYAMTGSDYRQEFFASLCQSGCKGFCDVDRRPIPKELQRPGETARTDELMAWCGVYGGDHCLTSISKLRRLPKDFGIDNQQAFFVFGCVSGGKKSCQELRAAKAETKKIYKDLCVKQKREGTCARYAALLVMDGDVKKARAVLDTACNSAKDSSSCMALAKHDSGPAKK